MSSARPASARSGSVLQDVLVDARPRALARPGARPVGPGQGGTSASQVSRAPAQSPAVEAAQVPPARAEHGRSYEEGFRAGKAEAEGAQQAKREDELQALRRRAFEEGLEEGRQRGVTDGQAAGRQFVEREAKAAQDAVAARIAQLDHLLASVPVEIGKRLEQVEDDMVALCHGVICRILGDELVTSEGVAQHVREAIRESGPAAFGSGHGQVAIHVHPRDLRALEGDPILAVWLRQHASAGAVHWVGDDRVKLGGCFIRSAEGSLDARVETQLAALRRVLGARPAVADEAGTRSPAAPKGQP